MKFRFADVPVVDAHPNVCLDLAPGNEMIRNFTRNYDAARDFFIRYQDQLVYGTDIATWGLAREGGMAHALGTAWAVRTYLETEGVFEPPEALAHWREPDLEGFRGFGLDRDVLEKIYCTNFERLYGTAPAALHLERACEELRRTAAVLDEVATDEGSTNPARQVEQMLLGF